MNIYGITMIYILLEARRSGASNAKIGMPIP